MDSAILFVVVSSLLALSLPSEVEPRKVNPQITVMGIVYCDTCSNNTFSRHSYFLPGSDLKLPKYEKITFIFFWPLYVVKRMEPHGFPYVQLYKQVRKLE